MIASYVIKIYYENARDFDVELKKEYNVYHCSELKKLENEILELDKQLLDNKNDDEIKNLNKQKEEKIRELDNIKSENKEYFNRLELLKQNRDKNLENFLKCYPFRSTKIHFLKELVNKNMTEHLEDIIKDERFIFNLFKILNKNEDKTECKDFLKGLIQAQHKAQNFQLDDKIFDLFSDNLENLYDLWRLHITDNLPNDNDKNYVKYLQKECKKNIIYKKNKYLQNSNIIDNLWSSNSTNNLSNDNNKKTIINEKEYINIKNDIEILSNINKKLKNIKTEKIRIDLPAKIHFIDNIGDNPENESDKNKKVLNYLKTCFMRGYQQVKPSDREYKITFDKIRFNKISPDLENQFQFEIKDTKGFEKIVQFRIDDNNIYLRNNNDNKEYAIKYRQNKDGEIEFENTITNNNDLIHKLCNMFNSPIKSNDKLHIYTLFQIMEKYSDFDGDLNDSIRKTFEELADKQFIKQNDMEQQRARQKIIKQFETLIKTAKFTKLKGGLYCANIDGNTLFVDINNKFVRYNKGKVKNPLDKNNINTILNLDEEGMLEKREVVNNDGKNMLEEFTYYLNNCYFDKRILDKNGTKEICKLNIMEGSHAVENQKDGTNIYTPDGSNAKIKERKVNNNNEFTFIKAPKDVYENTSIESIKMNCGTFLKNIEFECQIDNSEKKKIIMKVNDKNEKEYYYMDNKGKEIKINNIDTINNIEKQIRNFQLSFYDNLYAGYREKYKTNALPFFQVPINLLLFVSNTNYRFGDGSIYLPEKEKKEEKQATIQANNIIKCIKDMKKHNKTTCYIPFETERHTVLLRIKQYTENDNTKYSITLYDSGGVKDIIKPFFDKNNKLTQSIIEKISKGFNIKAENIEMNYKDNTIKQRGPTCVMASSFLVFLKNDVDNLRNKYKQLQPKQNKLDNLTWKQTQRHVFYKEDKEKLKNKLFENHEMANIIYTYRNNINTQHIFSKKIIKNKTKDNNSNIEHTYLTF